ncbi:Ig-like domain-containing protein [Phenylobacterium terrae]|uniref:Ig-like domain-containing protein n=1 Tax=Phenylobacterium terrae TaxID=2665495 RepID=A0ABW4N6Q6_9CAUL
MTDFTITWLTEPRPGMTFAPGVEANTTVTLSENGRYALLTSNGWPGDATSSPDVFLKDLLTGELALVSKTAAGVQSSHAAFGGGVSGDGRYVVFTTSGNTFDPTDANVHEDVYRKDMATGEVVRVSTAFDGAFGSQTTGASTSPLISADGRFVFFTSSAYNIDGGPLDFFQDVFRKDMVTGEVARVSRTADGAYLDGASVLESISSDGRYASFISFSTNLVPGDTNGQTDAFRKDLVTGEVIRISTSQAGVEANGESAGTDLSSDGRYAVFFSGASNLVEGDTNGQHDVFWKDLATGQLRRVSEAADGTQANGASFWASVSADGRYVTFVSDASNLVAGDTNGQRDVFWKDLHTGEILRINVGPGGVQSNALTGAPQTIDGQHIVFWSYASNLAAGDTNERADAFLVTIDRNDPPSALDDTATVAEDATTPNLVPLLLANDADPDAGDDLRILSVDATGALGAVAFDAAAQTLTYSADHDDFDLLGVFGNPDTAADTFSYTLVDSAGNTSTAAVAMVITAAGDGVFVSGRVGNETLSGGAGEDTVLGLGGADVLFGAGGADSLDGGSGADTLDGGAGHDRLRGDSGNDRLLGQGGRDTLVGDGGNDSLAGGDGADRLEGGAGNDRLEGGAGDDTLLGGGGIDAFVFGPGGADEIDLVADFGREDRIHLAGGPGLSGADTTADVTGDGVADTVLTLTTGQTVVLSGFTAWSDGLLA